MRYTAVARHRSEYPQPITFVKGTQLTIGEKYEGPEAWDHWYLCRAAGQQEGWVPGQIIERLGAGHGQALEDYTARELDVDEGDVLISSRTLNGWAWCERPSDARSGWVPLESLEEARRD